MKILVTGAGGFLGQVMVEEAVRAGHQVRAWVRESPMDASGDWFRCEQYLSDLSDFSSHPKAVDDVEVVIHCAAITSAGRTDAAKSQLINVDAMRNLLAESRKAGVQRWIQISSMSAHPGSSSVYGRTKLAGDEILRNSTPPPEWTILRPSLIYGPGSRGLVAKTLILLQKLPVLPLLGSGRERIRPVFVNDVAQAALRCIDYKSTFRNTYMVGGCDEIDLREFLKRMLDAFGLRRPAFPIPLPAAMLLAKGLGALTPHPPISVDNVLGVREAQRVDNTDAVRDFGYSPLGVEAGLARTVAASAHQVHK